MHFLIIFVACIYLLHSVKTFTINNDHELPAVEFGAKYINPKSGNQTKRDLSISYAATNIDSKEGTRVKTITVIKNHNDKKNDKIAINPELHKNEDWAKTFRDNFDSYGKIPDVPDIDDLLEFMSKKGETAKTSDGKDIENKEEEVEDRTDEMPKPVTESSMESNETPAVGDDIMPVEKIKGDAELVPSGSNKHSSAVRLQSISLDRYRIREPVFNVNYSTPHHTVQQYFENYVDRVPKSYDYAKPCPTVSVSSITVTTPSGRNYDIPVGNNSVIKPYIAPAIAKKTKIQTDEQDDFAPNNMQTYSVNSILPPLQPTLGNSALSVIKTLSIQPSTTSQRPYVAPNLRNSSPSVTVYRSEQPTHFRTNIFGGAVNRPNAARSRGLRY